MKTALKIAAGLGAISALSSLASAAYAQNTATATATASATIIQSISVTASANLGFGAIVKPTTGASTIAVSSTGDNRSITGGNAVAANGAGVSSAAFLVQGEGGSAISVTVPASFNMTSGANTLVVTTDSTSTAGNLTGSIGSQGSFTVGVGGSFALQTTTASGAYSGNLVVTAQYN
jgi:hypothetical protein